MHKYCFLYHSSSTVCFHYQSSLFQHSSDCDIQAAEWPPPTGTWLPAWTHIQYIHCRCVITLLNWLCPSPFSITTLTSVTICIHFITIIVCLQRTCYMKLKYIYNQWSSLRVISHSYQSPSSAHDKSTLVYWGYSINISLMFITFN